MMRLPAFEFLAPSSVPEAIQQLGDHGPQAALVAGGTDLYPNMKRRQLSPPVLIGLQNVPELNGVRESGDGDVVIGAGVTLTHVAENPLIRRKLPALVAAIATISTPVLRNMGTIGGNLCLDTRCHFLNQSFFWRQAVGSCLKAEGTICQVAPGSSRCWAITSADLPPLLIALKAQIRLAGPQGQRQIALDDLYQGDGIRYLTKASDELLTEIVIPRAEGVRATYLKLRRRGTFDFPALGVAATLRLEPDGVCASATVVLGAVTSQPLVMSEAEKLVGQRLMPELIEEVSEAVMRKARPLHLADYDHLYRKRMVSLYVKRALQQLAAVEVT